MQYIEAPHNVNIFHSKKSVFLGGGISGCYNWQTPLTAGIYAKMGSKPFTVVNPKRNNFDLNKKEESSIQIKWEYKYLRLCAINLFWFPKETLCPITLFELGSALERMKSKGTQILIGVEPGYARAFDIEEQVNLAFCNDRIATTLEELQEQLFLKLQ